MKPRSRLAPRLAFGLCGLGGISWLSAAQAQLAMSVPTSTISSSTANPVIVSPYQDRFINGGSLVPDISAGDTESGDSRGLARSLQIDGVRSVLSSGDSASRTNVSESGVVVRSQGETTAYGVWTLDASARTGGAGLGHSAQGQEGAVTLRQRAIPFDGGWQADNGVGDLNSPDINLARVQPRFYLPTGPMQGVVTEWRGPSSFQLVAGGGVPGLYDGIEVPGFRTLGGSTATAGAQWAPASNWVVGGQLIEAHDVSLNASPATDPSSRLSSTSGLLTAAWQGSRESAQLNLINGNISGNRNSSGGWLDSSISQGRFLQNLGIFRIDPNLMWGNQLIANDVQGGYYRLVYQRRQWFADFGIDEVRSVSGRGSNTTFLTGDARYQVSRDSGIGAVANVSRTDGGISWSLEGYIDQVNVWSTSRAQVYVSKGPTAAGARITLDETWATQTGIRLSTSMSVDRIGGVVSAIPQDGTVFSVAMYGGGQFTTRLGLEGNLRWATSLQGRAAEAVSSNVAFTWQLSAAWKILATDYDSRVGSWTPVTVTSPLTQSVATAIPAVQEHGVFLTFRYLRASGSHFVPLGGAPGSGTGELTGIVYLDANNNGRLDADETGAPNVTVMLDGRFSVQTDVSGHFLFPAVAAGHHVLSVVSDNLPLPWAIANDSRVQVEVATRDRTYVSIAAQRLR